MPLGEGAKDDEVLLWAAFGKDGETFATPREAGYHLGMNPKRVWYLCEKWATKGIYNYGVSCDIGWKETSRYDEERGTWVTVSIP